MAEVYILSPPSSPHPTALLIYIMLPLEITFSSFASLQNADYINESFILIQD